MTRALLAGLGWAILGVALAGEAAPTFTKKPTATRAGDKVKIEFEVSRPTDVAVFIEDAKGQVVRHLVAGVLGKNPPKPLKPDLLTQAVEWDGKADWGKPAPPGPFKVRVTLGMGAAYDKVLASEPESFAVFGLAVGPDGTLYAATRAATHTVHNDNLQLVALNRDGTYQRTVIPVPADFTREGLAYLGGAAVEVGGRLAPVVTCINGHQTVDFWPGWGANMAVTPDGLLLVPQGGMVGAVPLGSAVPPGRYAGAKVSAGGKQVDFTTVAVSGDGRWVYVCGDRGHLAETGTERLRPGPPVPAVYRAKLPERTEIAPFFGDPAKAGADQTHLASPCGLALDGKGNLLIADSGNNRVVAVSEKDGSFVGSFPVEKIEGLAADPKSGAVYVLREAGKGAIELAKFGGWKDPKALAKVTLNLNIRGGVSLALDTSASPPVAWVGGGFDLLRIEDQGDKFGAPAKIGKGKSGTYGNLSFAGITVDRYREDPEIYSRRDGSTWTRFNEASGKVDTFVIDPKFSPFHADSCIIAGPNGLIYTLEEHVPGMFKFDHAGKCLTWEEPHRPDKEMDAQGAPLPARSADDVRYLERYKKFDNHTVFARVCMGYMTHTIGVRPDGHVFVFDRGPGLENGHRGSKALYEYEPSGKKLPTPIIWFASDNVVGPKFDQEGNIYVAEQVRPANHFVPREYSEYVGAVKIGGPALPDGKRHAALDMYGSILKFTPRGGMIDFQNSKWAKPYVGELKLDAGLKTQEAAWGANGGLRPAKVIGAEWMHLGISHVNVDYCNCENVRFDVDPFGRVWYPDIGRCRIDVLDTAGNELMHFGGYGNADGRGPESRDKKLAEPDIAFAWPLGVAVTDRYAYMGDVLNRRLLRAKLVYAAEETCEVK